MPSKLNVDFRNVVKTWEQAFSFLDNYTWIGCVSPLYRERILVIASQCGNKRFQDFRHYSDKDFQI